MIGRLILIFIFISLSEVWAGYYSEYHELENNIRLSNRYLKEAQNKVSELNQTWNHFWRPGWTRDKIAQQNEIIERHLDNLKSFHRRKKHLETKQYVRVWTTIDGQLNSRMQKLGELLHCDCGLVENGDELFADQSTESALTKERLNSRYIANFAARQEPYIKKCLENKSIGQQIVVDRSSRSLCKRPDTYAGTDYGYQIVRDLTGITLKVNMNVAFLGAAGNKAEMVRRTAMARTCIIDFYARFGMAIDLIFDTNSSTHHEHHHTSITMHDEFARANANHWATHKTVGRTLNDNDVCALAIHEFGHKLGLPDTYVDPACPDRPQILPYPNLMSNSHYHPDDLELNSDQIAAILGPLCN